MDNQFKSSQAQLERALRSIPLGAQTFSKSYIQYPEGFAPLYVDHAKGGLITDVDGNTYVDLVLALLPITLGYADPDVNQAIQAQLQKGITFSLSSPLETQLAEKLIDIIPCAEMVRFGKNGSDVTAAAVRLARAVTNREHIAVCGYHGWQDWYIGSTSRHLGVPESVQALTHPFQYNQLDSLHALFKAYPNQIAAVIMEPVNKILPDEGFLASVKALAHQHGALFIFDEVVTGFRVALGGAQAYYDVTPDLACFGKGIANGMPLSALVGRADLMSKVQDIFYSGTFGGETLSLAAALATLKKMQTEPVIETLWKNGTYLSDAITRLIERHQLRDVFQLTGLPPFTTMQVAPHAAADAGSLRTLFIKEMIQRGVLTLGANNVCYAHTQADLDQVISAHDQTYEVISEALLSNRVPAVLGCPSIQPVFSVR